MAFYYHFLLSYVKKVTNIVAAVDFFFFVVCGFLTMLRVFSSIGSFHFWGDMDVFFVLQHTRSVFPLVALFFNRN